jgi:peptidoglycan/xylan/chitin deacetylase (PgdA/CDA1 family)
MATRALWQLTRQDRTAGGWIPPVLCYHRVLPMPGQTRRQAEYSVTPEQFSSQMSMLASEGFTSLTLEEFSAAVTGASAIPERSVLVTFDDGFADNYKVAWPIAKQFGVKLNLFVCTGLVEGMPLKVFEPKSYPARVSKVELADLWQPLSWDQLREMAAGGVGLGFHSHAHQNMGEMSAAEVSADTTTGFAIFARHLDAHPRFFAFPYGQFGSYTPEATAVLSHHGVELFFTTELGRTPLSQADRLFSRIVIHPEDDPDSFRRKLYGGYDWVGSVRRLGYALRPAFRPFRGGQNRLTQS